MMDIHSIMYVKTIKAYDDNFSILHLTKCYPQQHFQMIHHVLGSDCPTHKCLKADVKCLTLWTAFTPRGKMSVHIFVPNYWLSVLYIWQCASRYWSTPDCGNRVSECWKILPHWIYLRYHAASGCRHLYSVGSRSLLPLDHWLRYLQVSNRVSPGALWHTMEVYCVTSFLNRCWWRTPWSDPQWKFRTSNLQKERGWRSHPPRSTRYSESI